MFLSKKKQNVVRPDFRTPEGFEELYNTYWKLLYRLCRSYTDDAENSKELVQEIFESLWKNREKLIVEKEIQNYLIKSAKLKAFQFIRNKVSRQEKLDTQPRLKPEPCNETEHQVNLNLLTQRISLLVNHLPDQAKKVYTLSREDGLNNKEIASVLSISPKTVENHLTKALKYLRKNLLE